MKAILVIDMPTRCEDCNYAYSQGHGNHKCILDSKWKLGVPIEKRSVDCPLKPMPQRQNKDEEKSSLEYIYEAENLDDFQTRGASYLYGYIDGWNDCLKEIEGD